MKPPAIAIRNLEQISNHCFEIQWSDGIVKRYQLNDLQKECPCALCGAEEGSPAFAKKKAVQQDVRARRIFSVGRYAMRIEFTSGCSTGIYSYEFLYKRGARQ